MIVRTYQTEVRFQQRKAAPVAEPTAPVRVQRWWTPEEIETLDRFRAAGMSFGRIARKMNRTRNSLIGFDWRRRQA